MKTEKTKLQQFLYQAIRDFIRDDSMHKEVDFAAELLVDIDKKQFQFKKNMLECDPEQTALGKTIGEQLNTLFGCKPSNDFTTIDYNQIP